MAHHGQWMLAAAVTGFVLCSPSSGWSAPVQGAAILGSLQENPLVQDARVFCYNRRTGRFLHWGYCRRVSRPRVYCMNRRTGRFLHWGSCWR
ncbi:hypothetical protein [Methylobacterium nodulans]|uniref:Uncharacterized protein n=1 Tax=Methylobacterium nodulans (strain LMG 21967 / CNCM I-2342 / ORS 2060) TaxID=460265 RepID=B8ICP1_METNO|nr:hypothetical protein [Methylobacterium nodulans]ACL57452.1 hypothetical protein Mnod_2482 [Methylobacterium nodulans ORS 2060]